MSHFFNDISGDSERTRTSNLRIRNPTFYPVELRNHSTYDPRDIIFLSNLGEVKFDCGSVKNLLLKFYFWFTFNSYKK